MKIKIPTSWADVSIKQYRQLIANFSDKELTEVDLMVSNISVLTNTDYSTIEDLSIGKIRDIYSRLSFIGDTKINTPFPNVVKLGDEMFYCDPNANMKYGQYKAMREWTKSQDAINENLHNIVSLFLKQPKKNWSYRFEDKSKLVNEHCRMDVVFHISGFFLNLYPELLKVFQSYSLKKAEQIITKASQEINQELALKTPKRNLWKILRGLFSRKK